MLDNKESDSNDSLIHIVEFLNVHNTDRGSSATQLNHCGVKMYRNIALSILFP